MITLLAVRAALLASQQRPQYPRPASQVHRRKSQAGALRCRLARGRQLPERRPRVSHLGTLLQAGFQRVCSAAPSALSGASLWSHTFAAQEHTTLDPRIPGLWIIPFQGDN